MVWPARSPPVRSAMSRRAGGARPMVLEVHSLGNAGAAAARAFTSSSTTKDEVTHDTRLSQLQPRDGQVARRSFIAPRMSESESEGDPNDMLGASVARLGKRAPTCCAPGVFCPQT